VSIGDRTTICTGGGKGQLSTVIKNKSLDGWVQYCDGSIAETHTTAGIPNPHYTPKPTTSRPSSTTKPTFTTKPLTTTRTTSSTSKPTTTSNPGGGNGCISKHWDQCGGTDWKGCTVCAVILEPFFSFSNPEFVLLLLMQISRLVLRAREYHHLGTINAYEKCGAPCPWWKTDCGFHQLLNYIILECLSFNISCFFSKLFCPVEKKH